MSIEAMKDTLEALEWLTASNDLAQPEDIPKIVINLRTAIEAAENVQPYGWANLDEVTEQFNSVNCGTVYRLPGEDRSPLYTNPPAQEFVCSTGLCHYKAQRQWVGLGQDDIDKLKHMIDWTATWSYGKFACEIERILKEKNA